MGRCVPISSLDGVLWVLNRALQRIRYGHYEFYDGQRIFSVEFVLQRRFTSSMLLYSREALGWGQMPTVFPS